MFELRSNIHPNSNFSAANFSTSKPRPQINLFNSINNSSIEKLDEILNDIECIQETKEHHVKIEFNWLIDDIFKQINERLPGEKIESDEFYYKRLSGNEDFINELENYHDEDSFNENDGNISLLQSFLDNKRNDMKSCEGNECCCCCKSSKLQNTSLVQKLNKNGGKVINELICDYFIENSKWQLEMNVNEYFDSNSSNSNETISEYISINAVLLTSNSVFNEIIEQFRFDKSINYKNIPTLLVKLKFYLLDSKFENIYKEKLIEKELKVSDLLRNPYDLKTTKFGIEKFCNLNELTNWLVRKTSKDFAILCDLKIYFKKCEQVGQVNEITLKKCFKHIWTIRNWKVYLIENKSYNSNDTNQVFDEHERKFYKNLFKLHSKQFYLKSAQNIEQTCKQRYEEQNFIKNYQKTIDYLLKQIKWKLQLYPKGYSEEYSNNLSLFLNFNEINKNFKDYVSYKLDNCINLNELSFNFKNIDNSEENSSLNEIDMILLLKPKFTSKTSTQYKNQQQENLAVSDENTKLTETFVKACFQISIVDDSNKKIDICETDKQLFELYGSWGYKEYLLINDLLQIKEKYLKNNYKNLHLNCVIKLYYTTTLKFYVNQETNKNSFYDLVIKSHRNLSKFKIDNLKYNYLNSLRFDLNYLFKTSYMYDLIIQAPVELNDTIDEFGNLKPISNADDDQSKQLINKKFKNFKVHKLILSARSIIFERMFSQQASGTLKSANVLQIVDFNAFIVNLFLKYLYIDTIDFDDEFLSDSDDEDNGGHNECEEDDDDNLNLFNSLSSFKHNKHDFYVYVLIELFKIADKYCVYKLKNSCELKLILEINNKNLINLLLISHLYNSSRLKLKCFNYLAKNLDIVVKQKKKLNYLELNYPNLLAEAFRVLYLKDI